MEAVRGGVWIFSGIAHEMKPRFFFLKKLANCLDNILFLITVFMIHKTSFQNISEMLSWNFFQTLP